MATRFSGNGFSPLPVRVLAGLIAAVLLGSCATQPSGQPANIQLTETIHAAVPAAWRDQADSMDEITPLEVSPQLREFLLASIRPNDTDRDKLLSLIRAVLDRDGVGLEYDAGATHTAAQAFDAGAANCMGFSNLLVASARELGLDAEFELVSHRLRWQRADDALIGTLHVRVTSQLPGSRLVFDFYPMPIESGYSTQALTDQDALAHHLNNLATDYLQEGYAPRAYALMYKAIEASPNTAFIWSNLGILLSRNEFEDLAESAFKQALLISPDMLSAMANLQRLYHGQGRHEEVAALGERLADHRARNPYFHAGLGEQAFEQGNYEQAVAHFKDAVSLKKDDSGLYESLADSYRQLGNNRAAIRALRKARAIDEPSSRRFSMGRQTPETGSHITRK